jgi:hypothetical protein
MKTRRKMVAEINLESSNQMQPESERQREGRRKGERRRKGEERDRPSHSLQRALG